MLGTILPLMLIVLAFFVVVIGYRSLEKGTRKGLIIGYTCVLILLLILITFILLPK